MRRLAALLAAAALALLLWLAIPAERSPRTRAGVTEAPDAEVPTTTTTTGVPGDTAAGTEPQAGRARGVDGAVTREDGTPIPGADVRALAGAQILATTGADGTYAFADLPVGSYPLRASAKGYAAVEQRVVVGALGGGKIDFVLHDAVPIAGRVLDQHGMPVEGALLRATFADGKAVAHECATDSDGAFVLDEAYAGNWWLRLAPPHRGLFAGAREFLATAGGPPLRFVLQRGEGEHRLVVEAVGPDGVERPISAASLWPDAAPWVQEPMPGPIGRGRVIAYVSAGRWRIELTTPVGTATRVLDIPPGTNDIERRIEIGQPGTITGHADVTGLVSPPASLGLSVSPRHVARWLPPPQPEGTFPITSPSSFLIPTLAAEDGYTFRLVAAQAGEPIDLFARGDGCYGHARVLLESGGEERVEIRMRQTGTLRLKVANPPPVRPVFLAFVPEGEDALAPGPLPWSRGVEVLDVPLPAGRVRWRATWLAPEDGLPQVREGKVTIEAGQVTEIEADLR